MSQAVKNSYTVAEYLALEEKSEVRHEYYQGQITQMAGGSLNYNRIALNVAGWLNAQFALNASGCESFVNDVREAAEAEKFYTYPDIFVVGGQTEVSPTASHTVTNPYLIFEVLSPSTSFHDRNRKFSRYKKIASLSYYIWIEQDTTSVTCNELLDGKWVGTHYDTLEQTVEIAGLNLKLPLTEIYKRVEFPDEQD